MATKEEAVSIKHLEEEIEARKSVIEDIKENKASSQQWQRKAEEEVRHLKSVLAQTSDPENRRELERKIHDGKKEIKRCKEQVQQWEKYINRDESSLLSLNEAKDKVSEANKIQSEKLLDEALRVGSIRVKMIILLLLGLPGVGKTCLKSLLLDELPPLVRHSTPCAERPTRAHIRSVSGLKVKTQEGGWKQIGEKGLLSLIAHAIYAIESTTNTPVPEDTLKLLGKVLQLEESSADGATSNQPSNTSPDTQQSQNLSTDSKEAVDVVLDKLVKQITEYRDEDIRKKREAEDAEWLGLESLSEDEEDDEFYEHNLEQLQTKDSDEDQPQEEDCDKAKSEEVFGSDWVYFTDSGGQPQFHELLPLFIHNTSATLFVTRLSESLDSCPLVEYYKDGKPVGEAQHSTLTTIDTLKCLIRSMQSRPTKGRLPKIVVVGTHKDLMKECSEKLEEKNKRLLDLMREYSDSLVFFSQDLNQLIFPVDTAHPEEEDKEIAKDIRGHIERTIVEEVEVPIWWYILELLLRQLAEQLGREVLSRREYLQIAHALKFRDDAFDAALSFFHNLNVFHYYPETLPEVVFVNSQVPLDKLTELVDFSFSLRQGTSGQASSTPRSSLAGKWLRFRDQGIIELQFLEKFQQHYVKDLFTPHSFLKLLNKLLIAAPLTDDDTQPTSLPDHFMPALLNMLSKSELDKHRILSSAAAALLIRFPEGWPRAGVFCCLVIHLMTVCGWKVTHKPGKVIFVSRNCIKFCLPKSTCYVTLIDAFSHIEVYVKAPANVCKRVCPMIQESIITGIETACTKLQYNNDHPHLAIFCPHTSDDDDELSDQQSAPEQPPSIEQLSLSERSPGPKENPSSNQTPSSTTQEETSTSKEEKLKPHAARVMAEDNCWMCTESELFGELEDKHKIWLSEQVQHKPDQKEPLKHVPISSPQILTDFVPLYDLPDNIVENSASLRWKLSDIHQRGINGEGIVIAILDDGINSNHNAFKQAKKECRINTANFVPGEDKTVYDCELSSHGTMAVFIAGGEGFSNVPCGVAPNASLLVARIGKNKVYSVAAVIAALEYLIKRRETKGEDSLHIVSMSFGMPYDPDDKEQEMILSLIHKLKSLNVVCVASAGNYGAYKGGILFPARSEDVISVGALTVKGYSSQSNAPTGIDVLAPGEYVPVPSASLSVKHSNKVESCSGSSCAAPAIAGLIALMMHYAKKCESKPEDRKKYHTLIFIKSQLETMKVDMILEPSRFFGHRLTEFEYRLKIEKLTQMVELLKQPKQ